MPIPSLTESTLRQQATAESFRRGQGYYQSGAVSALVQRGNLIQAEVEGSQYEPYQVSIAFDKGGITNANCTCPYDWGGWCKHIVAALLACLHEPEAIEARPPLEESLAGLDRGQLQALLLNVAAHAPGVVEVIESQLALLKAAPAKTAKAATSARRTAVDPQPIRRQVRAILHSLDRMRRSEAYWHVGSVVDDVRQLLKQAQDFIAGGDGRNALAILEAITDEYIKEWTILDDSDGEASGFFGDVGPLWTEAILMADLTPAERQQWVKKLDKWQSEIGRYGVEDVFGAAQAAAVQGWDYPPLQRVLQGEITDEGAWDEEAPWYADSLAIARLKVLEQQERYQEYLHLAEAEGQLGLYVAMLAKLGRTQEAIDEGLQYLATTGEALRVAQVLRERAELAAALRIAEHGLTLNGDKAQLATWLCDVAAGMGDTQRALQAAVIAFRAAPSLSAYLKAQELSGGRWPELRKDLLEHLRKNPSYSPQAHVDVFLHERLYDDAIVAVKEGAHYALLEQVMDAVIDHRPDWVIKAACREAERIMDSGQARYYQHAVGWLERARKAYRKAGRQAEWQAYLGEIRARHGRKYKLMGMLDGLGK